ncbi:hypothetical protein SSX86_015859 [Deinandra increscens subsp. villosa]|uniref:Uncharacterized protein n=1 Tax=Deinandra increscens subsp. villosa TaxID=3103831 RepID=A0AAP0D1N2_9ASTR
MPPKASRKCKPLALTPAGPSAAAVSGVSAGPSRRRAPVPVAAARASRAAASTFFPGDCADLSGYDGPSPAVLGFTPKRSCRRGGGGVGVSACASYRSARPSRKRAPVNGAAGQPSRPNASTVFPVGCTDLSDCDGPASAVSGKAMAPQRRISQLQHNSTAEPIEVRVLHKWKPFHTKPNMTYLLIDKHGDAIQAMFHADEQRHLDEKIKVMECYTGNAYKCSYAPTFNRVVVHPASLEIDRDVTSEPLVDDGSILKMYFNFLPYDQLSTRRLKNQQLTDFIGKVDDLEHAEVSATNSVLRMKVTAPGCRPVVVALWKEIHSTLDLSLMVDADCEVIVALTALKVVPHQGDIQLQSSGGTRVVINPQIPVAQEMAERFKADRLGTPVNKLSLRSTRPVETVVENEIRTIGHLYQQDVQTLKQEQHMVEGVIAEFTKGRSWFFVNCTACKCRIFEDNLIYSCPKHKQQHLTYSYSVNCTIEDHTGTANVTIFDKGILTMTGIRCYDMISDKGFMDHNKLPPPIEELKGTKWLIQLRKGESKRKDIADQGSRTYSPAVTGSSDATAGTETAEMPAEIQSLLVRWRYAMSEGQRISQLRRSSDGQPLDIRVLKGDAVEAIFNINERIYLEPRLAIMGCYTLTNYTCTSAPDFYRIAPHTAALYIDRNLNARRLVDNFSIPWKYFNFLPFNQLRRLSINNEQLTDYIGKVTDLEEKQIGDRSPILMMTLQEPGARAVVMKLSESIYTEINLENITTMDQEVIVAATALRVVPGPGLLCTPATTVSVNPGIPIAKNMAKE